MLEEWRSIVITLHSREENRQDSKPERIIKCNHYCHIELALSYWACRSEALSLLVELPQVIRCTRNTFGHETKNRRKTNPHVTLREPQHDRKIELPALTIQDVAPSIERIIFRLSNQSLNYSVLRLFTGLALADRMV